MIASYHSSILWIVMVIIFYLTCASTRAQENDSMPPPIDTTKIGLLITPEESNDTLAYIVNLRGASHIFGVTQQKFDSLQVACREYNNENDSFNLPTIKILQNYGTIRFDSLKHGTYYMFSIKRIVDGQSDILFDSCFVMLPQSPDFISRKFKEAKEMVVFLWNFLHEAKFSGELIILIQTGIILFGLYLWIFRVFRALYSREVLVGRIYNRYRSTHDMLLKKKPVSNLRQRLYDGVNNALADKSESEEREAWRFVNRLVERYGKHLLKETPYRWDSILAKFIYWLGVCPTGAVLRTISSLPACINRKLKKTEKYIRLSQIPHYSVLKSAHNLLTHEGTDSDSLEYTIETKIQDLRQRSHLEYIWAIAFTSPLIGLFGTIWGLAEAFYEVYTKTVETGLNPDQIINAISGGIYNALATTFVGLFMAITFMFMYYHYNHKLERIANLWHRQVADMIEKSRQGTGSILNIDIQKERSG